MVEFPLGGLQGLLAAEVLASLADAFTQVEIGFDDDRRMSYYVDDCFRVHAGGRDIADGGFTT